MNVLSRVADPGVGPWRAIGRGKVGSSEKIYFTDRATGHPRIGRGSPNGLSLIGIPWWSDLGPTGHRTDSAVSWAKSWVMMMKNDRAITAYQTQRRVKGNNWIASVKTSRIKNFGQMLLRLLNHLVGQPAWRTLPGRYCNGPKVVLLRQGLVRFGMLDSKVPQLGDLSAVDDWSSRLDSNVLVELALISCRQLGQYYPR